ncbi:MAG TPA: patatin-like phospholipase family protein [Candidatus Obscuribacterales bacterium]
MGKITLQIPEKKRALVLPGGGGRGAYQVGVAKAFKEVGIHFDMIFGTSIGALNGTMIAQGSIDRLEELWSNLRPWDIFKVPSVPQLGRMVMGRKLGLLDTSPLEEMLRREIDLKKLKTSAAKLGLFTTDLCCLETRLIIVDEIMSNNELIDVLMATAAVPIAFPPRQLHGNGLWVDGGLVRNTPLRAAIDRGAEEIFMILLHPEEVHVCPSNMWQVLARCLDIVLDASARKELELAQLYNRLIAEGAEEASGMRSVQIELFQPRKPVNLTLLEIDPEHSRNLIQQGYEDAMDHLVSIFQSEAPARAS